MLLFLGQRDVQGAQGDGIARGGDSIIKAAEQNIRVRGAPEKRYVSDALFTFFVEKIGLCTRSWT